MKFCTSQLYGVFIANLRMCSFNQIFSNLPSGLSPNSVSYSLNTASTLQQLNLQWEWESYVSLDRLLVLLQSRLASRGYLRDRLNLRQKRNNLKINFLINSFNTLTSCSEECLNAAMCVKKSSSSSNFIEQLMQKILIEFSIKQK